MTNSREPRKVLVPLDVTESGETILSAVEEIVRLGVQEIRLLHVANVRNTLAAPEILDHDREVLEAWRERLVACGAASVTVEAVSGIPAIEIVERSERDDYALIVLGSHGRNLVSRCSSAAPRKASFGTLTTRSSSSGCGLLKQAMKRPADSRPTGSLGASCMRRTSRRMPSGASPACHGWPGRTPRR